AAPMTRVPGLLRVFAAAVVVAAAAPAFAVVTLQKTSMGGGYTGGTLGFQIATTRVGSETALVIHDVTPTGMTLLRVSAGSATLDCTTTPSAALGPDYPTVTCNVGGELQAHVSDFAANPAPLLLTYRAPPAAATVVNTATASCTGGCTTAPTSSASATVVAPSVTVQKTAPATVRPGDTVRWTVTVSNSGPYALDSFTVDDTIPAGATLLDVAVGGATFSAADLATPKKAPDGTTASLAGATLTVQGGKLASMAAYSFSIDARVDSASGEGATIANVARATPLGGAPVASPPATTTVQTQAPPLILQKRVNPTQARIGDSVTYTLTVTPNGPQPGPITLLDPLDPALKAGAVKVNGNAAACGAAPAPSGDLSVSCGSDGRMITVALPAGGTLAAPLTVEIAATVLPSASTQVQNVATLTDANGASQTAAQPLTVANASTTGASLTITAAKLAAAKDDLVPFVVQLGVPIGAATLGSPVVSLTPSRGLRVGDVRVTAADGTTMPVKPIEAAASLLIPIGTIAPGATASVVVRTRLNGRAAVGGRETLRATLTQDATALASASATVRVEAEAEFDLGTLLGEVFRDDNGNGRRDRGEPGLAGALVVMDDGLQAVTDAAGRYHLAAVPPGDRAIKLAEYTLPPGSTLTTDVTRIVPVTPGSLVKIDFGVRVPAPEPPLLRPQVSTVLPELRPGDAGGLIYRLAGMVVVGARVTVDGHAARVDKTGAWSVDVTLRRGQNRFAQVTEWPDGRVVVSARDVFWTERAEGGSLIIPRDELPRLTLRFPAGALAEPTFLLEGAATAPLRTLSVAGQALAPDKTGKVALKLRVPESGAGIAIDVAFADGLAAKLNHTLQASGDFVLLVGLAEGKVGYVQKSDAGGSSGGLYASGRVKLYAKGRIQGRWLLEGGIDIDTSQLDSWRDLFRGDPQRIF
ncbi:MAG: flagellar motor protein, partial [bacterium]|nr:flagellar motor protein [bacterium]